MAAAFEGGVKPGCDDVKRGLEGHHALAEGNDVGVVMLAAKAGGFKVPTESAADAPDTVGDDGFAVARTAENYTALAFTAGDSFGNRTDEQWVIDGGVGEGAEITDFVPKFSKEFPDGFLVLKAGVVRADGDFHTYDCVRSALTRVELAHSFRRCRTWEDYVNFVLCNMERTCFNGNAGNQEK
jgi:hypothetical protein